MHTEIYRKKCAGLWLAAIAWSLSACGSNTALLMSELDPVTGVTVTRAATPLVFYRDTSARAAYARDYVNLGPIQVNRMGQHRYFIWLGVWSTMQGWQATADRDTFEAVTIFADGEPLQLELSGWTVETIGATEEVYLKPVASSIDAYYETTVDQLRLIAEARDVRLLPGTGRSTGYEPWDNQPAAFSSLQAFLRTAMD
jgi:hypothetical protein